MYQQILNFILKWEGGYVNNPADPGGATKWGITQRTYNQWRIDQNKQANDVKDMSREEMETIYRTQYWRDSWESLGFPLAACLMDTAVNMGIGRAQKFLELCGGDYVRFMQLRIARYKDLIINNPKLKQFENGWMNRMADLRRFIDAEKTTFESTNG